MQSSTTSTGRRLATAAILGAGSAVLMAGTAHADGLFGAGVGAGTSNAENPQAGKVALVGIANPVDTKLTVLETSTDPSNHDTDHLLTTYCIQEGVAVDPKETYDEKGWANDDAHLGANAANLPGIGWILNNSYPKLDLGAITAAVNAQTPAAISSLTPVEAVEATQAAIWHFSDNKDLDTGKTSDANVVALYNYLKTAATGHVHDQGHTPQLSLGISPSTVTGATAGDKVGPFTLTSSDAKDKFVTVVFDTDKGSTPPAGSKIVDKDGNEVTPNTLLGSGDKVWVEIPDGADAGHIVLRASGQLPQMDTGRVFVTHDGKTSQNLIVATSQNVYVRDYVDIAWKAKETVSPGGSSSTPSTPSSTPSTPATSTPSSPAPSTPSLAHTGAGNTAALAGGAAVLVAAGGGLVLYTRRTKRQGSH